MSEFLMGFVLGFAAAGAITFFWYHGDLKPKIEELKASAEKKLGGQ